MRVISWNMGCSYGSAYKQSNPRTWQQLMAWQPDIALIQETFIPSEDLLEPDSYVFTPYGWSSSIGTLVYARSGAKHVELANSRFLDVLPGQVTLAEVEEQGQILLVASIHADTAGAEPRLLHARDAEGVGGSHTTQIYPVDLILSDLTALTAGRKFIVGGDLNASVRFDDLYDRSSPFYGNVEWFAKARDAGWCNAHRKFHAGDERTLFRPGKEEHFQLDHVFTDAETWDQLTRCDVLNVPFLTEFTDHAPVVCETAPRGQLK